MEKDFTSFFEGLKKSITDYADLKLQLTRVQAYEKIAKISSVLFGAILLAMLFFFTLFFVSITAGFYFSKLTSGFISGFGIVAMIYVVLFIVVLAFKKPLIEMAVTKLIIKALFENYDEEQNN